MSSELAHLVGFVSNYKQDACGCVVFYCALERKCALQKSDTTQGPGLFRFKEKGM